MKFNFDCIFYYVRDLERSVQFYSGVLGLDLESRDVVARYRVGDLLLELVPTTDEEKLCGTGNARLCLEVPDIGEAAAQLRTKGVQVGEVQEKENGYLAPLKDPDRNELILWQYRE
jgi:catechol 2,3-dioxygenase-like lactoylglutathione lyase family enzyme